MALFPRAPHIIICLMVAAAVCCSNAAHAQADLTRPFIPDAQTTQLFHLDDLATRQCRDEIGGPAGVVSEAAAGLGRFGGGVSVNGERGWVDVRGRGSVTPETALTAECWVKFRTRASGDVLCRNMAYMIRVGGGVQALIGIDGQWRKVTGSRQVPVGRWVHLAISYDQADQMIRLYIDGRLDVAAKPTGLTEGKLAAGDETLRIGTNTWNPDSARVDACVDEVRISSVARQYTPLPAPGVAPVPPNTNLLPNPGFEFGRYGWRPDGEADGALQWQVISDAAPQGRCFLRSLEAGGYGLCSYPVRIVPGKAHTLSVALRADKPADTRLQLIATGMPPEAKWAGRSQTVKVTTDWQRFSLKYDLPEDYAAEHVYVRLDKPRDTRLDIDAASLMCEGERPEEFSSSAAGLVGAAVDLPAGNIFPWRGAGKMTATVVNADATVHNVAVDYRLLDALDREVATGKLFSGALPAGGAKPVTLSLPTSRVGWFTLAVSTSAEGKPLTTLSHPVNVIEYLDYKGDAFASPLGMNTHMEREPGTHLQHNLGTLARCGVKWIRAWWGWGMAEKQPGQFDWTEYDRQYADVHNAGMEIMPILLRYYPNYEQAWAGKVDKIQQPPSDVKQWGSYVEATVKRFQGRVRAWEVWNESSYTMDAKTYAEIMKTTYERAKAADPQARVVGFAGVPLEFIREVFDTGAASSLEVLSHHSYSQLAHPFTQQEKLQQDTLAVLKEFNVDLPVWHTEQGTEADGAGYLGVSPTEADCAINLVQSYLATLGTGVEKFFWFSAQTSPTYGWAVYYEDYIPRPRLVALNGLARLLQGRQVKARQPLAGDKVAAILLDGPSGPAAALWNLRESVTLTLAGSSALQPCDMFCNPEPSKPAGKLPLTLERGRPLYLLAKGMSLEALRATLEAAQVGGLEKLPLEVTVRAAGDELELRARNTGGDNLDADVRVTAAGLLPNPLVLEIRDLATGADWSQALSLASKPSAGRQYTVQLAVTTGADELRHEDTTVPVRW